MAADEIMVWRSMLTTSYDNVIVVKNFDPGVGLRLIILLVLLLRETGVAAWTSQDIPAPERQANCHHGGVKPKFSCVGILLSTLPISIKVLLLSHRLSPTKTSFIEASAGRLLKSSASSGQSTQGFNFTSLFADFTSTPKYAHRFRVPNNSLLYSRC